MMHLFKMVHGLWFLLPLTDNLLDASGCLELKNDTINKYKARLVAKGFHQVKGFDFIETFSSVVKPIAMRIILALAASLG